MSNAAVRKKMKLYKVCILGMLGVGTTAIKFRFTASTFFETYDPTGEDCYRKQAVVDGEPCMLELLDIHMPAQEGYSYLREQWITDSDAFLIVYSISSRESFAQVEKFWHEIQNVRKEAPVKRQGDRERYGFRDGKCRTIFVVGNKIDRVKERVVSEEEGKRLAENWGVGFKEISAKTGEGVDEAIESLVRVVIREWEAESREKQKVEDLAAKEQREKLESYAKNERRKLAWWKRLLR